MREFIKKIYPFIVKINDTVVQFAAIIIFASLKYRKNLSYDGSRLQNLLILGNGPSLKDDLVNICSDFPSDNADFLCVNSFADSEYFEKIKPKHYVLIDPHAFKERLYEERLVKFKNNLLVSLKHKTTWDLNIYVPKYYLNSEFVNSIKANKNIRVIPINNIPLKGGFWGVKKKLFSWGLGNPIFQNVLVASIFIGIQKGYKNIEIYGADHNWTRNLLVSEGNLVILKNDHFHQKENIVIKDESGNPKKLHKFLDQIALMFKEYHTLSLFAKYKGVKIVNRTSESFIDAFERANQ